VHLELPTNIDDVIRLTDEVIRLSIERKSRHGYFAAAYKHVTITIQALLKQKGYFHAPDRIEALDVAFARRYMTGVFEDFGMPIGGEGITPPWRASFATLADDNMAIMQHLMTGVTVHVHYDLGIATAQGNPGAELQQVEHDFAQLNKVFSVLGTVLMEELAAVSPAIKLLNDIPAFIERPMFFITSVLMRQDSWGFAEQLAPLPQRDWVALVAQRMDQTISLVDDIAHPPALIADILQKIAESEEQDVVKVIEAINQRAHVPFDHRVLPT